MKKMLKLMLLVAVFGIAYSSGANLLNITIGMVVMWMISPGKKKSKVTSP